MDELDIYGVEDARITPLGDEFLITYVGVSPHGIVTKLLATKDFKEFRKIGTVFTTENKDVVLFPDRVNGRYCAFHRPLSQAPLGPPEIWLASSKDLRYWGDHRPVLTAGKGWASLKIGAGCPPLRTQRGWLEIFHGVQRRSSSDRVGKYCGGAALFDLDDPAKLLGVSPLPLPGSGRRFRAGRILAGYRLSQRSGLAGELPPGLLRRRGLLYRRGGGFR